MIENINKTFLHCNGIGLKTELKLKSQGFNSWEDCLANKNNLPLKGERLKIFIESLLKSKEALETNNINFFVKTFPKREHWRILAEYFNRAAFFDIETTGISWYDCHPTVIVTYKNKQFNIFVYPDNLNEFLDFAENCDLLVSFNGNCFDIPFLERYFNIPEFRSPHIDLRWVSYHAGYKSGLKEIEKKLGIIRPSDFTDINGNDAIILYYKWKAGEKNALEKLIQYCKLDTYNSYLVAKKILSFYDVEISNESINIIDIIKGNL